MAEHEQSSIENILSIHSLELFLKETFYGFVYHVKITSYNFYLVLLEPENWCMKTSYIYLFSHSIIIMNFPFNKALSFLTK